MKKPRRPRALARPLTARPIDSPYLLAQEAVVYLRLNSLSALYTLAREHRLPYGRRGGRVYLFDKRELDLWVKRNGTALERLQAVS